MNQTKNQEDQINEKPIVAPEDIDKLKINL